MAIDFSKLIHKRALVITLNKFAVVVDHQSSYKPRYFIVDLHHPFKYTKVFTNS